MNNQEYTIQSIDNLIEHLKELKERVSLGNYQEAQQTVDGVLNASNDIYLTIVELSHKQRRS